MFRWSEFFSSHRAVDSLDSIEGPLATALTLSFSLAAWRLSSRLSFICMGLLLVTLLLRRARLHLPSLFSYLWALAVLVTGGYVFSFDWWSPELILCGFIVMSSAQAVSLKKPTGASLLVLWLLSVNAATLSWRNSGALVLPVSFSMLLNFGLLLRLHVRDFSWGVVKDSLRGALWSALYTVPFTALLLVVLQQIAQNNFIRTSNDYITGISDELKPGTIEHFSDRIGIAYKVTAGAALQTKAERYWRVSSLTQSHGLVWSQSEELSATAANAEPKCWLPQTVYPWDEEAKATPVALDPLVRGPESQDGNQTALSSICEGSTSPPLTANEQARYLELKGDTSPALQDLVARWKKESKTTSDFVRQALNYFQTENFRYTRHPKKNPSNLDDFIFRTREGFCEYYAAAFATLMRVAQVPARVVIGFRGGDYNAWGDFWTLSYRQAHAWTEVWAEDHWLRVDPTAGVGFQGAYDEREAWVQMLRANTTVSTVDQAWEAFTFWVNNGFLWFKRNLANITLTQRVLLLVGYLILFFLVRQLLRWTSDIIEKPEIRFHTEFQRLMTSLKRNGFEKGYAEGFDSFRLRTVTSLEQTPASKWLPTFDHLLLEYQQIRFQNRPVPSAKLKLWTRQSKRLRRRLWRARTEQLFPF